ncbi:bifunctional phosphoribosyl-AMP cyclohydrolase/phosphoribosyl-ATP diphosphatase HisIE [Gordoniibacillus kamchatkensis]|uniref:bifunctional phosphoribosyl-AMP cyclohydrolase/phosphoribosyl-ATP diphosphatase HisIE n=1 Tax=Gordoniibacillus kamchatkensis TaxID=1590651 RepID=UPI0006960633|nr:bifunctional phosphoribosyl-AMP cyclohydrolase/phosphoribosyl-ATP diphosphatase HisIE [Paenibacillus sp. VKM B-2647]
MPAEIKYDAHGLVPAIVQDVASKEVLMLAYMNAESLERTVKTGETWFWSRSRQELWHKGATSGHTQAVVSLKYDCDADTLLVLVEQKGPACHTGKYSCFYNDIPLQNGAEAASAAPDTGSEHAAARRFAIVSELESLIASRDAERPEGSYTTYLFEKGLDKILKKFAEEAAEVVIAAKNNDNDELRCEASDVLFHLLVLLRERKLPLDAVLRELENRHVKGSDVKYSRRSEIR